MTAEHVFRSLIVDLLFRWNEEKDRILAIRVWR
jgi:hypothetical protein